MTAALLWKHEAARSASCVGKAASAPKRLCKPWTLLLAIKKDGSHLALFLRCAWSRVGRTLCQPVGEATCTKSSICTVKEGLRALKCASFLSSCISGSLAPCRQPGVLLPVQGGYRILLGYPWAGSVVTYVSNRGEPPGQDPASLFSFPAVGW